MASKDKDMMSLPGYPWDAILEAAKHQLPSLDSDSSLSDCEEEEPYIFQRNEPVLIPDLAELLAEDSAGGDKPGTWFPAEWSSPPELLLVPGELPTEPGSGQKGWMRDFAPQEGRGPGLSYLSYAQSSVLLVEEAPTWLEDNLGSLSCNIKGYQSPPWSPQEGEATISQEGELKADSSDVDLRDSAKNRALRRERRKMIEKDVLQKVMLETQGAACAHQGQGAESGPRPEAPAEQPQEGWPVLSLQQLEEWDLDYILQSLRAQEDEQGDGAPRTAWWLADSCQGQDHTLRHSQDRLLEKLTLLCATQSRACAPAQKMSADTPQDTKEQKAINRCALAESSFQAELCQELAEDWQLKTEPPTIFIDLRQTELPEHQSSESSEHSSSDSNEEEDEDRGVQQGAAQAASSSRRLRDCTGKSQLLQQLRAFRKGMAPSQLPTSKNPGDQKAQVPEDAAELGTGRKKHVKLWAEEQNAQIRFPGGLLGTEENLLHPGSAKDVLVPALGQL